MAEADGGRPVCTDYIEKIRGFFNNTTRPDEFKLTLEGWDRLTVPVADKVESLLASHPPARVLDLACGTGGVAIVLAQRGYDVTAVDCSPARLSVGLSLSAIKPNHVKWVCADIRTIEYPSEMDYVLLRDVIFSTFDSPTDDVELLGRIARSLRRGGRCLFEVYDKDFAIEHGVEKCLVYDREEDRFVGSGEGANVPSLRLYAELQWNELLNQQGLKIVGRHGWQWNGDPTPPPWRGNFIIAENT